MFYVIEITNYMDGTTPTSKGIYSYPTQTEAVATYHQKMGGAMKNANYANELVIVTDADGGIIKDEYWARPTEQEEN